MSRSWANAWSPTYTLGEGTDNHARPTLTVDSQGYLHAIIGGHHTGDVLPELDLARAHRGREERRREVGPVAAERPGGLKRILRSLKSMRPRRWRAGKP